MKIDCENCAFAKRAKGILNGKLANLPFDSKVCMKFDGSPDPKNGIMYTKPDEVLQGAECYYFCTEEEYKKTHRPDDGNI